MDDPAVRVWLAIIGVASVVQVVMLAIAAVVMVRIYRRTSDALAGLQREVGPLVARVNTSLDELHEVLARIKDADAQVRRSLARTTERAGLAVSRLRSGVGPLVGIGRGVLAALATFRRRQPAMPLPTRESEAHLAYEGGTSHVRS
jgi:hypothetical protein